MRLLPGKSATDESAGGPTVSASTSTFAWAYVRALDEQEVDLQRLEVDRPAHALVALDDAGPERLALRGEPVEQAPDGHAQDDLLRREAGLDDLPALLRGVAEAVVLVRAVGRARPDLEVLALDEAAHLERVLDLDVVEAVAQVHALGAERERALRDVAAVRRVARGRLGEEHADRLRPRFVGRGGERGQRERERGGGLDERGATHEVGPNKSTLRATRETSTKTPVCSGGEARRGQRDAASGPPLSKWQARGGAPRLLPCAARATPLPVSAGRSPMKHLIPSHQNRPTDDPIFALHKEATERLARGEDVVNATVGTLMDDAGKLALLGTAARLISEVPPGEWAAYAPIAGSADFHRAVIADTFRGLPELEGVAVAAATPGGSGALKLAIVNYLAPGDAMLTTSSFWSVPRSARSRTAASRRSPCSTPRGTSTSARSTPRSARCSRSGIARSSRSTTLPQPERLLHEPGRVGGGRRVPPRHAKKAPVTLMVDMAYAAYAPGDFRQGFDVLCRCSASGARLAWSASKTFTHYGLRVGALIACEPDAKERVATSAALSYSMPRHVVELQPRRALRDHEAARRPGARRLVRRRACTLQDLLNRRVALQRARQGQAPLPPLRGRLLRDRRRRRSEGPRRPMRERGVFVVPFKSALRLALCAVPERDVARVVASLLD